MLKEKLQERLKKFDLISFIESYEKPEKKISNNYNYNEMVTSNNIIYSNSKIDILNNINNTKNINKFKSFYKLLIKEGYDKNIVETFFKDKRNIIDLLLSKYPPKKKYFLIGILFIKWV